MNAKAPSRLINVRPTQSSRMLLREWVALLFSFSVIGVIGILAFTDVSATLFTHLASEVPIGEIRPRTAAIVVEINPDHCQQFTFDNDTGSIFASEGRLCEGEAGSGAANKLEPIGTIRRLDAISKSFLGKP
jgi:hypothetical protein